MKRFLFLFSDTGGGHRAGAESVKAALQERYGDEVHVRLVDGFKDLGTMLGRTLPVMFPYSVKYGRFFWDKGYKATNSVLVAEMISRIPWTRGWEDIIESEKPDAVVYFHASFGTPAVRALRKNGSDCPVVAAVLDMITLHSLWIAEGAHSYIVPTKEAGDFFVSKGIDPKNIQHLGIPLHPKFDKLTLSVKKKKDRISVLITGGGEGLGAMRKYLKALDACSNDLEITIICGRNKKLKQSLAPMKFKQKVNVLGFVTDIERHIAKSDVVLAKAGPFAICEAIACKTPILLYDFIPGLEEGNILFVEQSQIGKFVRHPRELQGALDWIVSEREEIGKRMEGLVHTDAAYRIADYLMQI